MALKDSILSPRNRVRGAWVLLVMSIIGWPVSQLTVAKNEPPVVLALSWIAIIITCIDVVSTNDARDKLEE